MYPAWDMTQRPHHSQTHMQNAVIHLPQQSVAFQRCFCSGIGVLFHNYAKSLLHTPTLPVWEQATEVSATLQFQTGVEGRSQCWYRGAVTRVRSGGCVTSAIRGTSLSLNLLIPAQPQPPNSSYNKELMQSWTVREGSLLSTNRSPLFA